MQGGDVTSNARGDGQLSVYGPTFEDENFLVKHDSLGIIQEHIHIEKKIVYNYISKDIYDTSMINTIPFLKILFRISFNGKRRKRYKWIAIFHHVIYKPQHA